jgi:hypothetical protein
MVRQADEAGLKSAQEHLGAAAKALQTCFSELEAVSKLRNVPYGEVASKADDVRRKFDMHTSDLSALRRTVSKMIELGEDADTNLPRDARAWQLFSDAPKVNQAAKELTTALSKAGVEAKKKITGDESSAAAGKILYEIYKKHVVPVMDKWSEVGASDSEPRNVAKDYLNGIAKKQGIYGWIDF